MSPQDKWLELGGAQIITPSQTGRAVCYHREGTVCAHLRRRKNATFSFGSLAISKRPMALRPGLTTGLPLSREPVRGSLCTSVKCIARYCPFVKAIGSCSPLHAGSSDQRSRNSHFASFRGLSTGRHNPLKLYYVDIFDELHFIEDSDASRVLEFAQRFAEKNGFDGFEIQAGDHQGRRIGQPEDWPP